MNKISLLALLATFSLFAQKSDSTCEIIFKINTLIQREHVNPKPINDSLSAYVFDNFIDELDPARNIFLKSEYDGLSLKYRLKIDDYIKDKDCVFLNEITTVYKKGLLRNKSILERMEKESINFDKKDTIRFYKKAFPIYLLEENLVKTWDKKIRYQVLDDLASQSKNLDSLKINFNTISLISKNNIIQNELCKISAILQRKNDIKENIYNQFCSYFDPHTAYFSDDTKSNFVASLSKEKLSLGLIVSLNEKNEIIVAEIDPNGPTFKNGKIKKGDQIISISNGKEHLKVSCSSLESISNLIQSDANKQITFDLKRKSSKGFKVTLDKEFITDEENTVFSFIIDQKTKTGYIKIPSFYSDFEGKYSKGCADDVAKEIIKLQKDKIKGLVIDLIDNGGGSMEEAIKLAGLFIDHGPISIIKDKTKQPLLIEDPYDGVLYKGPIVILINGNSASASEFFASILQDYNRALLIGSATLGKATMQVILPLEKNDNQNFVKVTINKFYRITGRSHQSIGVLPDVEIPSIYETIYQKESDFPTAFKNDTLPSKIKFRPYVKNDLIELLSKKSANRVSNNTYFNSIKKINLRIDALINQPKQALPMTIEAIFEDQNNLSSLWEEINNFDKKSIDLSISNSSYNSTLLTIYPLEKENNQNKINSLKTNQYLNEAILILEDFNALK